MKVSDLLKIKTGLPYYINHLIISLIIGISFGNLIVGASFYIGRELRDWEKLGSFDHKGFWFPVVGCAVPHILFTYIIN
jgi:hypothetical protein